MPAVAAPLPHAAPGSALASAPPSPPPEMRRFSAGLRVIVALLCILMLMRSGRALEPAFMALLLAYGGWSGMLLWAESRGRRSGSTLMHYRIDVLWTVAMVQLLDASLPRMALTLIPPVLQASIHHGVRQGVVLAVGGALGLLLEPQALWGGRKLLDESHLPEALAVLALGPAAALLSRPISVLRHSQGLVRSIETSVDPRRGLDALSSAMVEKLRTACSAEVLGLVLPAVQQGPALLSTADDGVFPLEQAARHRLETLLGRLPPRPASWSAPPRFGLSAWLSLQGGSTRAAGETRQTLNELAEMLNVKALIVVPLMRYERVVGHLLLGGRGVHPGNQEVAALIEAAPELGRLVERAELIDRLQEESAAHERMRIGRDLHDSAIQPYLGLKYAVESVTMRAATDNPLHPDLQELQALVNGEIDSLRELVSGLRAGEPHGDNALASAVRRQARRFSQLFGIEVEVDSPDELPTTRALAGAVFHMLNEALTNVRKHTRARRVDVRLGIEHGYLQLAVRDDAGSVLGQPAPDFLPRSLAERAASLDGTLLVTRPDGLNTELLVTVPLQLPGRTS